MEQIPEAGLVSDTFAHRIDPKFTWDDLVLPEHEQATLRQICAQWRNRSRVFEEWGFGRKMNGGFGMQVLFNGESGSGRTTAAEVIANDLQMNLHRIGSSDIPAASMVMSKFIGETEKNLSRVFDAAQNGGAILLFDEADALFGKRSEVKDSHDRFANSEVNSLMQRMESFHGLSILKTNMRSNLDEGFTRRLHFTVNFPPPDEAARRVLWARVFPLQTPTQNLDLDRLATFPLNGGAIKSTAVKAAFLAADAGTPVTSDLVLTAVHQELARQS
jgi:SpoVK/Ycf46/Vps4 family AAA+-type ATPase